MGGSSTAALILYLTFYILLSILSILWLLSILLRWLRIYPHSTGRSGAVGPTIVVFSTNQEVTRGLEPSVIETFPKFAYSESSTKADAGVKVMSGECVVCLGAYEENETLRLLPKCGHMFHVLCVDTWLRAHATCPFCRANLSPEDAPGGSTPVRMEVVIDGDRGGG